MEQVQRTGRLPGELRSTKKVIEVSPERTYTVRPQAIVERTFYGPCLNCARDIEYGFNKRGWRSDKDAEDWLLKQFDPKRRKAHIAMLEGRRQEGNGFLRLRSIEEIICDDCKLTFVDARAAKQAAKEAQDKAAREAEKRHQEELWQIRERWVYHTTWREASKTEARGMRDGTARFRGTRGSQIFTIVFRWRPVAGRCRGDCPRNVVGMWVDGKLMARYYGWNISPLDGKRPYFPDDLSHDDDWNHIWPPLEDAHQEDVFTLGFCVWLELNFQKELVALKPSAIWRTNRGWPLNVATLSELERPCVVHTEWINGSIYATILPAKEVDGMLGFAADQLHIKIKKLRSTANG